MIRTATKRQRARELRERLMRGPSLSLQAVTKENVEREVKLWLETWILPEVMDLVPELRREMKNTNTQGV